MPVKQFENYPIAFVETKEQLTSLLQYQREAGLDILLVAVTPEADYEAEKKGLRYRTIEEFYSEAELINSGIQNFSRLRKFCDHLDGLIHAAFADVPMAQQVTTVSSLYYLKRIADGLLNRVCMIKGVLHALKTGSVLCFDLPFWQPRYGLDWPVLGLTSRLAPKVAQTLGWEVIWVRKDAKHGLPIPIKSPKEYFWGALSRLGLNGIALWARSAVRRGSSRNGGFKRKGREPWLISDGGWDVDLVAEYWKRSRTGQVVHPEDLFSTILADRRLKRKAQKAWESVRVDPQIWRFYNIEGIDTFWLVEPTLRLYVLENIPAALAFAEKAPDVLKRTRPSVVLTAGVHHDLARASHEAGVPVASFQHGGFYGYADYPMGEYTDLLHADIFLAYGPGTACNLEKSSPLASVRPSDRRARSVSVGSPSLDDLMTWRRKARANEGSSRTVMYVNTNLGGDFRYHSYHMYADVGYWRFQRRVVRACSQFSDVRVIVKVYPTRKDLVGNPLVEWLEDSQFHNCEVNDSPFNEVLGLADAYIIDTPSTALLQALSTKKPVIVLADSFYLRFDTRAEALLRKRAIVADTSEEFLQEINKFLVLRDWTVCEPVNDEFLIQYGTHMNDGRAVDRSEKLLYDLAVNGRMEDRQPTNRNMSQSILQSEAKLSAIHAR
jgi:hypothetical protein